MADFKDVYMKMIFSADKNWGIGCDNKLLFRVKGDMAYFKSKTTGKVVVMGRSTLESLPGAKPLPNRTNIVLSSQKDYAAEGAEVCRSLEELLKSISQYPTDDVFVIGGESVYRMLMPYCDTAYVTRFFAEARADRYMPDFNVLPEWRLTDTTDEMVEDGLRYRFLTYKCDNPKE